MNDSASSSERQADPSVLAAQFDDRLRNGAIVAVVLAWLASAAFAGAVASNGAGFFSIFGTAVIVAAAAAAIGGMLGFLFGIPRTLQREALSADDGSTRYLANTNLEQISDWLTKILVGISLVQVGRAVPAMATLADSLRPMLGDKPVSGGFGLALCIYSALATFLVSYLWTRVGLKRQLQLADQDLKTVVAAAIDVQSTQDAAVLSLLDRQLSGQNPPSQPDIDAAFAKASSLVLTQAYQRAEYQRRLTWRAKDATGITQHAATQPVFNALIAADKQQLFHRHFGSLGYVLKDLQQPQYTQARDMLTKAIEIRDRTGSVGFHLYEWNRALCRILTDPAVATNQPSSGEVRAAIEADLRIAARNLPARMFVADARADSGVQAVAAWLLRNNLTFDVLREQ